MRTGQIQGAQVQSTTAPKLGIVYSHLRDLEARIENQLIRLKSVNIKFFGDESIKGEQVSDQQTNQVGDPGVIANLKDALYRVESLLARVDNQINDLESLVQ